MRRDTAAPVERTSRRRATPRATRRTTGRTAGETAGVAAWRGWPLLLFLGLIAAGLLREETRLILYNATLLCLSCMGLGN